MQQTRPMFALMLAHYRPSCPGTESRLDPMRKIVLCLTVAAALGGCTSEWDAGKVASKSTTQSLTTPSPTGAKTDPGQRAVNARLPDRGTLVAYDRLRPSVQRAAFTYHAIELSEQHALNAAHRGGKVEIQTPSGKTMSFTYDRHVDQGDGNWTWVGRTADGLDAVITFGAEAVVGRISQANTESLQLTYSNGRSWLVEADPRKLRHPGSGRSPDHDVAIVPKAALEAIRAKENAKGAITANNVVSAATGPSNTVDVVLGYTPGFVAQNGNSTSAAVTVLTNRIELANQAFASSLVTPRVRLVHTLQVNYTDTTNNSLALDQLSGQTCTDTACTSVPVPVELQPLRDAREQFGGDLVSLVRPLKEPEHGSCGVAWLIGPNSSTIDNNDAPFGYSVIGSGSDIRESDGFTYSCPNETLAHEMAHNMGQQHNVEDSDGDAGAHPYSYGYREARTDGFYTIMAYPVANSSQFLAPYFANPNVNHPGTGRPTGNANADNARSLNQTMLLVAQFRAPVIPFAGVPDIWTVKKVGGSNRTEIHILRGSSEYASIGYSVATALHTTGTDSSWEFLTGDYNRDGTKDLYGVKRNGGSGTTELHILNGATNFQSYVLNSTTALQATGTSDNWVFRLGDFNKDGILDLFYVLKTGARNLTEVHVMNGATQFQTFLLRVGSALHETGSDNAWAFELGDWNKDGTPDLFAIKKQGLSNTTELYILNGATNYQSYLLATTTSLHVTGTDMAWDFAVDDFNLDGTLDLYSIKKQGGSGRTEIHILDGSGQFRRWLKNIATGLHPVPTDSSWEFEAG
jgi:peptidyl-Asp metalloendopeptidase